MVVMELLVVAAAAAVAAKQIYVSNWMAAIAAVAAF